MPELKSIILVSSTVEYGYEGVEGASTDVEIVDLCKLSSEEVVKRLTRPEVVDFFKKLGMVHKTQVKEWAKEQGFLAKAVTEALKRLDGGTAKIVAVTRDNFGRGVSTVVDEEYDPDSFFANTYASRAGESEESFFAVPIPPSLLPPKIRKSYEDSKAYYDKERKRKSVAEKKRAETRKKRELAKAQKLVEAAKKKGEL